MAGPQAFGGMPALGGNPGMGMGQTAGIGPAGMFSPTGELGGNGDLSGISNLLQGLGGEDGQQMDPVTMLQQQIQITQGQMQQAQAQGNQPLYEQLAQKLQELQAQLQALTGGDQAGAGGDPGAGAPAGGGGGGGDAGGGAPAGGDAGGGAPAGLQNALDSLLGNAGGNQGAGNPGGNDGVAPVGNNGGVDNSPLNQAGGANSPIAGDGSTKFDSMIQEAAQKYGVDPNLVKSVIKQESGFNPNARSGVGAQGLMQLMPGTARSLGVKNPMDPRQNIMGGTKYLSQQLKTFNGDVKKALAAYNAGPGNVKKYGGVPPFKETQNYVKNITADYSRRTALASNSGTKTGGTHTQVASASSSKSSTSGGSKSAKA